MANAMPCDEQTDETAMSACRNGWQAGVLQSRRQDAIGYCLSALEGWPVQPSASYAPDPSLSAGSRRPRIGQLDARSSLARRAYRGVGGATRTSGTPTPGVGSRPGPGAARSGCRREQFAGTMGRDPRTDRRAAQTGGVRAQAAGRAPADHYVGTGQQSDCRDCRECEAAC